MSDSEVLAHVLTTCLRCQTTHLLTESAFLRNRPCPDCGGTLTFTRSARRGDFRPGRVGTDGAAATSLPGRRS